MGTQMMLGYQDSHSLKMFGLAQGFVENQKPITMSQAIAKIAMSAQA